MTETLLSVRRLRRYFPVRGGLWRRVTGQVHAVDGISFDIQQGETLGLVGESGCGKSTLGKTLLHLYRQPYEGEIWLDGDPLHSLSAPALKARRCDIQMIFQDPMESLNPRHSVAEIIEEPLLIHHRGDRLQRQQRVHELADSVGLPRSALQRYPHEFSGGQRQRVGIARAIALNPRLIVCDEPVSALDVSIQSQILNLLLELQQQLDSAMLFISHDLAVVRHLSHRIAVMYLGQLVETASANTIYDQPLHPYTQSLIAAIPQPEPTIASARELLQGEPPSPLAPPSGCRFHPRCPRAQARCAAEAPALQAVGEAHAVACHFWSDDSPRGRSTGQAAAEIVEVAQGNGAD